MAEEVDLERLAEARQRGDEPAAQQRLLVRQRLRDQKRPRLGPVEWKRKPPGRTSRCSARISKALAVEDPREQKPKLPGMTHLMYHHNNHRPFLLLGITTITIILSHNNRRK